MIRVTRSAIIDAPIERVWAILRDFNSHTAWHPVVAESAIENDEPSDQVGCVRNFTLKDGNHIREQLLALSDNDYISTYCILDATLPMQRYVATVQLKRVTDGDRTFWHWQSTFDTPRGPRAGIRRPRRQGRLRGRLRGPARLPAPPARRAGHRLRRAVGRRRDDGDAGHGRQPLRRPGRAGSAIARGAGAGAGRGPHPACRDRRQLHRRLCAQGRVPPDRAARAARHGSRRRGSGCRRRRCPSAAGRPRRLCLRAARRLCRRAHLAGEPGRRAAGRDRRGDGGGADAEGHDRRIPAASHPPRAVAARPSSSTRRRAASACCCANGPRPWAPA